MRGGGSIKKYGVMGCKIIAFFEKKKIGTIFYNFFCEIKIAANLRLHFAAISPICPSVEL
jgi:hypothetical protein